MLDFNTKRKILKKLSDTAERNFLLLLPCLIASGFVRLYYFIMCNLDIALSDEGGNFLGIKRREKKNKEPKKRRDDIVYVKRGFGSRLVSLVVSFAFVMMFVPTVMPVMESYAFDYDADPSAPLPATWDKFLTEGAIFIKTDKNVYRDIRFLFDDNYNKFGAPRITSISDVTADSCVVNMNLREYLTNLPPIFYPDNDRSKNNYADGVITEIALYAIKDGAFQATPVRTYRFSERQDITAITNDRSADSYKVSNLEPGSSYKFVLCAVQKWNQYSDTRLFTEKNKADGTNVTVTFDRFALPNYEANAVRSEKEYLPTGNHQQVYDTVNFTTREGVRSVTPNDYIYHYSDESIDVPSRTLDNIRVTAAYDADADPNKVTLSTADDLSAISYTYNTGDVNNPTVTIPTKGLLVYRREANSDFTLIRKIDMGLSFDPNNILVDNVDLTKYYEYYVCPVAWGDNSSINTFDPSKPNPGGKFMTGTIPSATSSEISNYTDWVWTKTADPLNFAVTQDGVKLELKWDAVENATGYEIHKYYKDPADAAYTDGGRQTVAATSFTDENVAFDIDYKYELRAINTNNPDTVNRYSGIVEKTARLKMDRLSAPYTIQVIPGDDFANVSWICDDAKAAGFDVQYMRTDRLNQLTRNVEAQSIADLKAMYPTDTSLSSLTGSELMQYIDDNYSADYNDIYNEKFNTQFDANASSIDVLRDKALVSGTDDHFALTIRNLTNGADYSFRVRSYVLSYNPADPNDPLKQPVSDYQPYPKGYSINISTPFNPPTNIAATTVNGNITVTWDAVDTATGYELEVSRYDSNGRIVSTVVQTTSTNHYELTNLRAGDIYIFRVRATKRISGQQEPIKTNYSTSAGAVVGNPIVKVTDLTATQNGDAVDVAWTAATGEFTGYYLYITNNGITTRKDITTNSYKHTDIKYGQTYSYYVVAYRTVVLPDGQVQYFEGDRSNTETITIGGSVGFPSNLTATSGDRQIALKWDAVAGAEGYVVYAAHNGRTESFNVTGTTFTHQNLTPGDTYSYYVVAYKTVNNVPVYSVPSVTVSAVVGGAVETPVDFSVTTNENSAILTWTAIRGVSGYTVYGTSDNGGRLEIDVSRNSYTHTNLTEGDTWTYYVRAYKLDNNQKIYSGQTNSITVRIGASFAAPTDLVATPGNRTVALKWTAARGVDGYIVYVYDSGTGDFQPLSIVSRPNYEHTGLRNGTKYTYMVAAYRFVNGARVVGDYSLAVSAIPTSGDAADVDYTIAVKGTAPYGITHSELISASANHDAFNEPVDAYFSVNDESSRAVKEVLRGYADGLKSFLVYPFDVSLYLENTLIEVEPNDGYNVTFTVPVPDVMSNYRDYITVIHLKDDGTQDVDDTVSDSIFVRPTDLEVLPSTIVDVNGIWCVQFVTDSCSPFAFVIYKDNLDDISSGSGAAGGMGGYSGSFNTGILLITTLPDMLPVQKKTKFVERLKKRYRIKK